jgi:hypothetical protein
MPTNGFCRNIFNEGSNSRLRLGRERNDPLRTSSTIGDCVDQSDVLRFGYVALNKTPQSLAF